MLKKDLILIMLMTLWGTAQLQAARAYATLSDGTLVFRYDNNRSEYASAGIACYDLNTEYYVPKWYPECSNITTVDFDPTFANARPTSAYFWFAGMDNLKSITHIEYFNTSEVTIMRNMFIGCGLESIDVSHFDTGKVTTMRAMFSECTNLTEIVGLSNMKTSNVKEFQYMFYKCEKLKSINLSKFTFTYPLTSENMCYLCPALKKLSIPSSSNNLEYNTFNGVGTETNPCVLVYPNGFTPNNARQHEGYFTWYGGYFVDQLRPYALFDKNTLTFYYDKSSESRRGRVYELTNTEVPSWEGMKSAITSVIFNSSFSNARPFNCSKWFQKMTSLSSITGLEYLNTSEVKNMNAMFANCPRLTALDLSTFDTSKVTDMSYMFSNDTGLASLNVSRFNTANVVSMQYMFQDCSRLSQLDVSKFDTSNAANMDYMFSNCYRLTLLDVSNFNTGKLQSMAYMFMNCRGVMELDLTNFVIPEQSTSTTGNVFTSCLALERLTLPATAENLDVAACNGVGTPKKPCLLEYPDGVTLQKGQVAADYFVWKRGFFKENKTYAMGDVNHDGAVGVTDVMLTVSYVMGNTSAVFFSENADVSGDGEITVADVTLIVALVIQQ